MTLGGRSAQLLSEHESAPGEREFSGDLIKDYVGKYLLAVTVARHKDWSRSGTTELIEVRSGTYLITKTDTGAQAPGNAQPAQQQNQQNQGAAQQQNQENQGAAQQQNQQNQGAAQQQNQQNQGAGQQAFAATAVSSGCWIVGSIVWWRRGWSNPWGPPPSGMLPVATVLSATMVIKRFVDAVPTTAVV